jgi:hypothetical protein
MDSITPCARTMPGPFCGTGSSSTSRASATRSMTTARRDAASVEVTTALHSDLGNSRRCEFVRRPQVMSAFGQPDIEPTSPND